jgi:hypothetical protein
MAFLCVRCEPSQLQVAWSEPISSAGYRATDGAEDPQDRTDDHQDPPDGDQDRQRQYIADDEQNNSENDHDDSISVISLRVSAGFASVPVAPPGDRSASPAQDEEHRADHQHDDPECLQNRYQEHETEDEQDDSENDHDDSVPLTITSVPVASTGDRAVNGAQNPQHRTDDQQDDADRSQDRHFEEISQNQQEDAQDNHDASTPIRFAMSLAGIELGCGK